MTGLGLENRMLGRLRGPILLLPIYRPYVRIGVMLMECARTRWPTVGEDLKLWRARVIGVTDLACG